MKQNIQEWEWIDYDVLESTNDTAKSFVSELKDRNIVITAMTQTKGRGRLGRNWISVKGNLFMSQIFRFQMKISDLVFISSLSVAQTVVSLAPNLQINIKWPNDVLLNGKKFCGILIESENDAVVIGIGVNLINSPQDTEVIYPVTDLYKEGYNISRQQFLENYLQAFDNNMELYQQQGFAIIRQQWLQYAYNLQQKIGIRNSNTELIGRYKGIDEKGFLLLEQDNKIIKISAGDVFL